MPDMQLHIGGVANLVKPTEWEAPDGRVAQRWKDEIEGRGGVAAIRMTADGTGHNCRWFVRVLRLTASSLS